jgi:lysophospholipase L1-like esterase
MGIPGIVLADVMGATSTANSYSHSGLIDLVLRNSGSVYTQAKALQPTFITLWIGNNDVLGFATSGGVVPPAPTDAATFGFLYNQLVDSLAATGANIIVANIPNVTAIPFFTTVGPLVAQSLAANSIPAMYYAPHGGYTATATSVVTPAQLVSGTVLYTLIGQGYASELGKPSGKFYRDYGIPVSLVGVDTTKPFGFDPLNPWPDALTLDPTEIQTAGTATTNFNNAIAAAVANHSAQVGLVDFNTFFNNIRASDATGGTEFNGIRFTTTFVTGGLFSLDGVHPTSQGYGIVANEFIKATNAKFGSSFSQVDISTIPGSLTFAKKVNINLLAPDAHLALPKYNEFIF